jgi:hypothetical protein
MLASRPIRPLVIAAVLLTWTWAPLARAGGFGGEQAKKKPGLPPRAEMTAEAAHTWRKLQQPIPLHFPNDTPLEDVLKHIKDATKGKEKEKGDPGLMIYVDPIGLQEAEKSQAAPVRLDIEGISLAEGLTLLLNQLGLRYYVRKDGLLYVTSRQGEDRDELIASATAPASAHAARTWEKLFQPISMPFPNETPLEDVIKYIKSATVGPDFPEGIPVYLDPRGLQESEKTETSPIRLNLEGLPLALTLKLLLAQLDLVYYVDDHGLLVISDEDPTRPDEPEPDRVSALEDEVAKLRSELDALRGKGSAETKAPPAGTKTGAAGGGFRSLGVR